MVDVSDGEFLLKPIYKAIINQGLLVGVVDVKGREGLYHIGLKKWILPFKYRNIDFRDNYIIVQNEHEKRYYTVSATGKLNEKVFDDSPPRQVEFADTSYQGNTFKSAGRVGYFLKTLDTYSGRVMSLDSIPAIFDALKPSSIPFLMIAKKDGKSGMIDINGKIKIPFLYDEIKETGKYSIDSIYAIKKDGKWGLIRFDNTLLPCEYDEIIADSISENGFYLKQGIKKGFYVYSDEMKLYNHTIACKYDNVPSYIYTITPAERNNETHIGIKGQVPFYVLRVQYNGLRDGFVDMNGNEFFK